MYISYCVDVMNCSASNAHFTPPTRTRQNCLVLSCPVRIGSVNGIDDKTRQFCLVSTHFPICNCSVSYILRITENLGRQNVLSCHHSVHAADVDKTKQSCLVRVDCVK